MHFGRALYSIGSGDLLTVIAPIDYLFCIVVLGLSVLTGALLNIKYPRSFVPWIWVALADVVILGLLSSNATVKLDAHEHKVYITRVLFYIPKHETYDIAALQGAVVRNSEQSDALRLVFSNGTEVQLTPYNQMDGKNQAAATINDFLQQHGGNANAELR